MYENGLHPVPRDIAALLPPGRKNNKDPEPVLVSDTKVPSSALAQRVYEYAKAELRPETFNHSMRVFHLGEAIVQQQFPTWNTHPQKIWDTEVYYLSCLLHDIGTTQKNLHATKMSFEFYGGILARDLVIDAEGGTQDVAESVAEAVFRHQDLGTTGMITVNGLVLQLSTILDNMGGNVEMVHRGTIDDVVAAFPRLGWSKCFAATIREENGLKPWAHTTALGEREFPEGVEGNKVMERYEE